MKYWPARYAYQIKSSGIVSRGKSIPEKKILAQSSGCQLHLALAYWLAGDQACLKDNDTKTGTSTTRIQQDDVSVIGAREIESHKNKILHSSKTQ